MKLYYRFAIVFLLLVIAAQLTHLREGVDHVAEVLGYDMGAVQP